MTALLTDLCAPWVGFTEVHRLPKYAALIEEQVAPYLMVASELCYKLSGRQFPGVCPVVNLRPCRNAGWWGPGTGADWTGLSPLPQPLGSSMPPLWWGRCRCQGNPWSGGCSCTDGIDQMDLEPYTPVVSIDSVIINGNTVDPSNYAVYDYRWLARLDGNVWPVVNRLDRDTTGADTWAISLHYGAKAPEDAQIAAATLAGELALAANPSAGSCSLPERIQTVTRQGVTYVLMDPQTYLDVGRTGIYLIDLWLKATNPKGLTRKAVLSYPGQPGLPGRVRQP